MFNRKLIVAIVLLILLPLLLLVLRFGTGSWDPSSLMVSPQTTVITGPVGPEGYPDYVATLDAQTREGITPDNNAVVLLVRALGPPDLAVKLQPKFFKRLGIAPPTQANYLVSWANYCKTIPTDGQNVRQTAADWFQSLLEIQDQAAERPWRRGEFPHLAKWLDANAGPLDLIAEASRRPKYYAPLVSDQNPPSVFSSLLPLTQASREAALALVVRAMLRLNEKQYQAAWDDLMACRRLGRLVGQGPLLVEALVGYAIEGLAVSGQMKFLAEAELTAEEWATLQRDVASLPPRAPLADKIDRGERFGGLDLILAVARQGPKALTGVTPGNLDNPLTGILLRGIDWNVPLATLNEWMDRFVAAFKIESPKERALAMETVQDDLHAMVGRSKEPWSIARAVASRRRASEKIGDIFVALMMPAISAVFQAEARIKTNDDLLVIGLALARYKAEQGKYPEKLEQLVPSILKALPADAFASTPFVYKKRGNGYLLYSLGANQTDEGGKGYDQDGDDLVIEIPRPDPAAPAEASEANAAELNEAQPKE
jgi:hypothetical protein